jgi:hypothetical protein
MVLSEGGYSSCHHRSSGPPLGTERIRCVGSLQTRGKAA